jgi:predicted anti-sigma-YlaC factor YlaD
VGDVVGSCDRAREWISADLDGELSEIERALLRAHVADCLACEERARAVAATTVQLRYAGLEQPELPPYVVARRSRVSVRTLQTGAAAAAVAAAAVLGTAFGVAQQGSPSAPQPAPSKIVDITDHKLVSIGPTYLKPRQRGRIEAQ